MHINIKHATLNDVNTLSKIHARSWRAAYKEIMSQEYLDNLKDNHWVDFFSSGLQSKNLKVLITYNKDTPVGCVTYAKSGAVSYGPEINKAYSDFGEIISIYLIPKYFHKGIGTKLLSAAIEYLSEIGLTNIYLWVLKENINAQKFYLKNGFKPTQDEYNFEISGKSLMDIRLIKLSDSL